MLKRNLLLLGFLSVGFWASTQQTFCDSVITAHCSVVIAEEFSDRTPKDFLLNIVDPTTQSSFTTQIVTANQALPFAVIYQNYGNLELGLEEEREGTLSYTRRFQMFATSYDENCSGCRGKTFSGTPVIRGVCAVDPNLIKLGSRLYIPDYGRCRAEDVGEAIKGNRIDLGFENVKEGNWSARFTDVYLLVKE